MFVCLSTKKRQALPTEQVFVSSLPDLCTFVIGRTQDRSPINTGDSVASFPGHLWKIVP